MRLLAKDIAANVLSEFLKYVLNDNVFQACAKRLCVCRGDLIADMTFEHFLRVAKAGRESLSYYNVWRECRHHNKGLICLPLIEAYPCGSIALFVYANGYDDLLVPNLAGKWQPMLQGVSH